MAKQQSIDQQTQEITRSLAASADARDIVRRTREQIDASRQAMRDSDARIEHVRARNRWKDRTLPTSR